jgi:hypothetical protein
VAWETHHTLFMNRILGGSNGSAARGGRVPAKVVSRGGALEGSTPTTPPDSTHSLTAAGYLCGRCHPRRVSSPGLCEAAVTRQEAVASVRGPRTVGQGRPQRAATGNRHAPLMVPIKCVSFPSTSSTDTPLRLSDSISRSSFSRRELPSIWAEPRGSSRAVGRHVNERAHDANKARKRMQSTRRCRRGARLYRVPTWQSGGQPRG